MILKTYRGIIKITTIGENEDALVLKQQGNYYEREDDTLAYMISQDIKAFGSFLTVRYYISDWELSEEALITNWLDRIEGEGEAKYLVHYSDYTGYLWTDQEFKIGGHDILAELASYEGKYLHLEIEYNVEAKQEQTIDFEDQRLDTQDTIANIYRKNLERYLS